MSWTISMKFPGYTLGASPVRVGIQAFDSLETIGEK